VGMTPHFGWPALASADASVYRAANAPLLGRLPVHPRAQQHLSSPQEQSSALRREGRRSSRSAHRLWPMAAMASTCVTVACMLPSLCRLSSWVDVRVARSRRVKVTASRLGWPARASAHVSVHRAALTAAGMAMGWPWVGHWR
jgi:hypothetical protein